MAEEFASLEELFAPTVRYGTRLEGAWSRRDGLVDWQLTVTASKRCIECCRVLLLAEASNGVVMLGIVDRLLQHAGLISKLRFVMVRLEERQVAELCAKL